MNFIGFQCKEGLSSPTNLEAVVYSVSFRSLSSGESWLKLNIYEVSDVV